ncbi:hypothetical protein GCK72_000573 [Caenorhabditis remanei]|uniref:Uncharacterized protein n=1 Tax=Caenorhabditis remanei TaxID=31234 RepID=A0A6A5HKQ4_CAERE|nr:hypothetical protein GCK72_000573 [Caenorhabditis remanei]KAF1768760.1 hypothetical protein GCK72_000573 [Caenorhabditis remanei]
MSTFERQILKNKDNLLTFEATISDIHEKLPQRKKQIDEIMKSLNEKRREVLQKQNEIAGFRLNRTENSMKSKLEKTKKKLDEMKKKKIVQDKKISRLRADIAKSEKSFDKVEREIHKEIQRQIENESKKEEIERRIKIFEVENSGISDEFQKLLVSLKEDTEGRGKTTEKRTGELEVLISKGAKYLEKLDERIRSLKEMKVEKSGNLEIKESLQKTAEEYQREADRSAQNLRNAENIRLSELNRQEKKLQPSIIIESKDEKREKEYLEKKEKLIEKINQLEKSTDEKKEELERIRRRTEFLKRQLKSYSELDLVQFENEKTEKGAEIRNLKRRWHEQVMALNALNKKLQQRVLQREAAMTKANSVIHLTTNVRDERNREIEELQKEMAKTRMKL